MNKDHTITTNRLYLRPIIVSDAETIWPHVSDRDISKFMSWLPHENLEQTREFIKSVEKSRLKEKGITWAIFFNDAFCGIFSIISILRKHRALTYDKGELAYWCANEHQGKGVMTEAGQAVMNYGFYTLKLNKIVVGHFTCNRKSEKLIERLGFRYIGTEKEAFKKNDIWYDASHYEITKTEYEKK